VGSRATPCGPGHTGRCLRVILGPFHQKPTYPLNLDILHFLESLHIYLSGAEMFFPAIYLEYLNQYQKYRMFKNDKIQPK
jgi:hypothetical protein